MLRWVALARGRAVVRPWSCLPREWAKSLATATTQPPKGSQKHPKQVSYEYDDHPKPRKIVKDSQGLATAMVQLIDSSEIDMYRAVLKKLRENPKAREAMIEKLKSNDTDAPEWWNSWLLRALGPKRTHLFPFAIPITNPEKVMEWKVRLAGQLFAAKFPGTSKFKDFLLSETKDDIVVGPTKLEEGTYRRACMLANSLGDRLSFRTLAALEELIANHNKGLLTSHALMKDVIIACSLHLDMLKEFFSFMEIPQSSLHKDLIHNRQKQRLRVVDRLAAEIGHFVYSHGGFDSGVPGAPNSELREHGARLEAPVVKRRHYLSFGNMHELEMYVKCYPIRDRKPDSLLGECPFADSASGMESSIAGDGIGDGSSSGSGVGGAYKFQAAGSSRGDIYDEEGYMPFPAENEGISYSAMPLEKRSSPIQPNDGDIVESSASFTDLSNRMLPSSLGAVEGASPKFKIMMDNLPPNVMHEDIVQAFKHCGTVKRTWLYVKRSVPETKTKSKKVTQDNESADAPWIAPPAISSSSTFSSSTSASASRGAAFPHTESPDESEVFTTSRATVANTVLGHQKNLIELHSALEHLSKHAASIDQRRQANSSAQAQSASANDASRAERLDREARLSELSEEGEQGTGRQEDAERTQAPAEAQEGANGEQKAVQKKKKREQIGARRVKDEVLKGNCTENYAFVEFEDAEGYAAALAPDIRLFGINVKAEKELENKPAPLRTATGYPSRTYPVHHHDKIILEMHDLKTREDVINMLNIALKGKFDCLLASPSMDQNLKPLYVRLRFHDHTQAWIAFQSLNEFCKEDLNAGHLFSPSWVLSRQYFQLKKKYDDTLGKKLDEEWEELIK